MNKLINLIEKVKNPGTFSVSGTLASIPPGLNVKGLGTVAFPLPTSQAQTLIELSEQAPFGRGEATIVDTTVRNVWQLSPEQFELTNPQWQVSLQEAIDKIIGKQLGLQRCKIQCEPYKLLIYKKGSFFRPHRDTEKIPNMFATLVVNLPSQHDGGELIVSHGGQSQHYSFADKDLFHPHFITFYADCHHEVKPITSGYRICLVYNLAIANRKRQPRLAQQSKIIEDVNYLLQEWVNQKQDNPILCYLLEHSYSERNLSIANLKNGDFAKAKVLLDAAEKNNCKSFLCLATYCRTSYGDTIYYDRYSYGNDLDEYDFEEYDVESEEIYAHHFITSEEDYINVKKLHLEEDEILAKVPLLDGPGRDVSISEATGNEGATKDLWYHRGAVIIWPQDRDLDMVTKMDINYGIHYLRDFLKEEDISTSDQRPKIIKLADYIIDTQPPYSSEDISQELIAIGEVKLLNKFLQNQMDQYLGLSNIDPQTLIQITEHFGWQPFDQDIRAHLEPKQGILQWLNSLLQVKAPLSAEGQTIIKEWFEIVWEAALKSRLTTGKLGDALQIIAILKIHQLTNPLIEFLSLQKDLSVRIQVRGLDNKSGISSVSWLTDKTLNKRGDSL